METHPSTIPVTVDKSHLITIGEKLYAESIELIRELVNNAYDADATEASESPAVPTGLTRKPRTKKPKAVALTPNAVIQRLKLGQTGITCCLDRFGEDGPECFTEGNVIYINRDHPLHRRQLGNREAHTMHLARPMTQEISLMKDPKDARAAFTRQSGLLRDAFREE
jgi:hypothetical protein